MPKRNPRAGSRRAVDLGGVEAVRISGLRRVPPHEIERLRSLFAKDHYG